MAKTGSYIKLDRGLKKNSLWLERPFSKGQAWVDLLLLAQGVNKEKQYRGQIQHQKSGVVYTSILYLTNRWGWSRNKVYRFLDYLMNAEMIAIQGRTQNDTGSVTVGETNNGTTNGTIISIVNWELYQYHDTNNDTEKRTRNGTTDGTTNGTHNRKQYKESNTEKAIKKKESLRSGSPFGDLQRGTDEFRNRSHLLLKPDEGTVDDIPTAYRDMFDNFADYWGHRNQ